MRDLLLTMVIVVGLPVALMSPFIGVLEFTWLAVMAPHRLTFGFAYDMPFVMAVTIVTMIGWALTRERKRIPINALSVLMLCWAAWITITTLMASDPAFSYEKWDVAIKSVVFTFLGASLLTQRWRFTAMVATIGLSIAFYGTKGGAWWILTGGNNAVNGPEATQINDNNALALALCMGLPLLVYLYQILERKWQRLGMLGIIGLNLIAVFGTYSRGGLLALGAVGLFLIMKSRHRVMLSMFVVLLVVCALPLAPTKWINRMGTMSSVENAEQIDSAQLRIMWWKMSVRLANASPVFGHGFKVFHNFGVYPRFNPDADKVRDVHSIYFEVLGEHGYPGLLIFVAMLVVAFFTGSSVIRQSRNRPDLSWAADIARMLQVSFIAYAVAGGFLTLATLDIYYQLIGVMMALAGYVRYAAVPKAVAEAGVPNRATGYPMPAPGLKAPLRPSERLVPVALVEARTSRVPERLRPIGVEPPFARVPDRLRPIGDLNSYRHPVSPEQAHRYPWETDVRRS